MANHKSAEKRIRQIKARRLRNRLQKSVTKSTLKKLRASKTQEEALATLPKVYSLVDKLAKRNIFHKNKAANIKSKLTKFVNNLAK
jgi:small subunit ribosomal protein S20